jgi:hypothetical protein
MREFVQRQRRYPNGTKHGYRLAPAEPTMTGRTLALTPKGDRQAFLQALERIHAKRRP